MDPLIALLLGWIAENTDYQTEAIEPPAVVAMTPQELTKEYYSGAPHLLPDDGVDDRLNALYSFEDGPNGTIFIIAPEFVDDAEHFDEPSENPLYREILLHELVHHVQWETGEADAWACQSYGEREAYILGGQYLRQLRYDDPLKNRMFWAHMYARC